MESWNATMLSSKAWSNPCRYIYAAPGFASWFQDVLPTLPTNRGRNLSPPEQVNEGFYEFVVGHEMIYGEDCRKLEPVGEHVWELKTTDVRVFGWFPRRSTFVAVAGAMKKNLKKFKNYQPFIASVVTFRDALPLDDPKLLTGGPADVL